MARNATRGKARNQPQRAIKDAETAERRARREVLLKQKRQRRLLELGASCFPPRQRESAPSVAAEQAISNVMLQSASDTNAPPVRADREMHRTSPAVRRLLTARRGANALLDEAHALGHLRALPDFALGASRYPVRALCGVCGYWGDMRCMVCEERYCGVQCANVHKETRCARGIY